MAEAQFVQMGALSRPHGIKGEICVDWYADSLSALHGRFFLQSGEEQPRAARALSVTERKGRPVIRLEGINDRASAERVRGMKLLVLQEDLPPLDEGEIYINNLIGLTVVLDEEDRELGVVDHVEYPAGNEVWSIVTPDGHEVLFPAVIDFVNGFDLEAGRVYISPPPGLIDIYLSEDS